MTRPVIPSKIRALVLSRDNHLCVLTGPGCLVVATECDHRIGRGMGGNPRLNVPEGLVGACTPCNRMKESDARFARRCAGRGLKLRRTQSTARDLEILRVVPVRYVDGWHKLTPDGHREPVLEAAAMELLDAYGLNREAGA